ncbi:hypothetical protein LCGC14_1260810 [marine sediment metagenome]|uniref:Glycosyl transferase family 1 domain-containing protein n=1 Tax=marine sediment metagenome TaxID=412755 RepID=A0A0F9LM39_9ZZZZ
MSKLKIFTTPWHCMHFWDLFNALKKDADFYLAHNSSKRWYAETRPLPENAQYVPYYEEGKYDLAILDVDQQCVNPNLGKTKLYLEMRDRIKDIPVVVINHASPVYPEYLRNNNEETLLHIEKRCKVDMRVLVGDRPMVTNSHQAASPYEWGWGHPIWHGMNPDDWFDLPKEPRVFTALSPAGCDVYYNREAMNEVVQELQNKYGIELWWARVNANTEKSFDHYRDFLGRSLIYLDTSFRTPINRGRTEAMLSGCCVVQVEGAHDLDKFAKHDENMIIVPNKPKKIAKMVADLLENDYKKCVEIGQNGRKMALKTFNYKRYRQDWLDFIAQILCKK